MRDIYTAFLILFFSAAFAQEGCSFMKDTVFLPKENKSLECEYLQTTLKNRSVVQMIKGPAGKMYLRIVIYENLYFDKVDLFEVQSGSRSCYFKDTKQYKLDKHSSCYIVDIGKNYVATLRDDGISAIVFGKTETDFSKTDCNQVKQISKCFYESISAKK